MPELDLSDLPDAQVQSYQRLRQSCQDYSLPDPLISISSDDVAGDTGDFIIVSWLRYDIAVYVMSAGAWYVGDLSKRPASIYIVPLGREAEWCQILKYRISMISPGEGANDMRDRGKIPWK